MGVAVRGRGRRVVVVGVAVRGCGRCGRGCEGAWLFWGVVTVGVAVRGRGRCGVW